MKRAAIAVAMLAVGAVAVATALPGGVSKDQQVGDQAAAFVLAQAPGAAAAPSAAAKPLPDNPGFYAGEAGLSSSEIAGREIWYKATAGNDRFHTYVFQQRIGVLIDWYRVLRADQRDDRFAAWGIINDPGCCKPGVRDCPAKSLDETYGFDWCPGDDELLKYVGKQGYRDPACDFRDAPLDPGDPHQRRAIDQRQSSCDLTFGTSTGALGFRKFPNPRFDLPRWEQLNGGLANWDGFSRRVSADPVGRARVSKLADGSFEPPFLIGTSCGSCHIAFDPLNPPTDPAHPKWENIKGAIGNQYPRISELLGSGMPTTRSSGRCSRTRGRARPTRRRSRPTR